MGAIREDGTKECPDCGDVKPLSEFGKTKQANSGVYPYCKPCCTKRSMRYYVAKHGVPKTPEQKAVSPCRLCGRILPFDRFPRDRKRLSGRLSKCRDCTKSAIYKTTWEDIERLRDEQNGICPCCLKDLPFSKEYIDHCHSTGVVRGILCHHCNASIGLASDDTETLARMINYINKHKNQEEVRLWQGE